MKLLILQLSDIHFEKESDYNDVNIEKIASAVEIRSDIVSCVIIVSGDITFSGYKRQYSIAYKFFEELRTLIKSKNTDIDVKFLIVPGNHDVNYMKGNLSKNDLQTLISEEKMKEQIPCELQKLKAFFRFAQRFGCFTKRNNIVDFQYLSCEEKKIKFNLINTAIFSSLEEDQGFHYIPEDDLMGLENNHGSDFVVTIMHHPHHWFCWNVKKKLEKILYEESDLIFVGHEHYESQIDIESNNSRIRLNHAGELCNKGNWSKSEFHVGLLDVDNREYISECYSWNEKDTIYIKQKQNTIYLNKNRLNKYGLSLKKEYLTRLLSDQKYMVSQSISDYYVFPLLEKEMDDEDKIIKEIQDMALFMKEIISQKKIIVSGGNDFGKTTLLKQLLTNISDIEFVIFITSDKILNNRFDKIIQNCFEEMYSDDGAKYSIFCQAPKGDKAIIIDDFDCISEKWNTEFFRYIEETFDIIVLSYKNDINFDMKERISQKALIENYALWNICPFYVDKRRELVSNIVHLLIKEDIVGKTAQDKLINDLCEVLSKQKIILSFTPDFVIQFVKYYCNNIGETIQNDGNIFGKVFESNLVNLIKPHAKNLSVDKIFIILDKISYQMHISKNYPMSQKEICDVIEKYNDEFDSDVNMTNFISILINARILTQIGSKYKFVERHYFAYFIAHEIKRKCLEENDFSEFDRVLRFACFGINSDILLFVTYMTDSLIIIKKIMEMADKYADKWDEFTISPIKIPYLSNTKQLEVPAIKTVDRVTAEKEDIKREKQEDKEKHIRNLDTHIYTYDEERTLSKIDEMIRILSLMIIISKTLPSFEHMMKKHDKEQCVRLIYTLPLKIFNTWAKMIEDNKLDLVEEIKELHEWSYRKDKAPLNDNEILNRLRWESMSLLLDLMNASIYNATKDNTHRFIDAFDYKKAEIYQLEHLMGLDNRDDSNSFVREVEKIYKLQHHQFIQILLKRVAKHHILTSKTISRENIQKLNEKLWKRGLRNDILLLQKEQNKKKFDHT